MKKLFGSCAAIALPVACALAFVVAASGVAHAQAAADVDKVVAGVKAKNPDQKALCASGQPGIQKAVGEVTSELAKSGQIKGDFGAIGQAAGGKIRAGCGG